MLSLAPENGLALILPISTTPNTVKRSWTSGDVVVRAVAVFVCAVVVVVVVVVVLYTHNYNYSKKQ